MSRPRVAIVGGVAGSRVVELPVASAETVGAACRELGRALAAAGWDLVVYSAAPLFVEADVVRGYVSAQPPPPAASVHVHTPMGKADFREARDRPEVFDTRPDPSPSWEVAFYRSLPACDGVLLVGGGRSTMVAGVVALSLGIPVVAVATFGGNAAKVWERLAGEKGFARDDDIAEMAAVWRDGSAERLVAGLERQRQTRLELARQDACRARREARRGNAVLAAALILLAGAVVGLIAAWGWTPGTAAGVAALALVPALAAAGGALVRMSLDAEQGWLRATALGFAAGLVTGLLYVASQLLGTPDVLETAEGIRRLLFFALPVGFVAGLTSDAVYRRWRGTDVSRSSTLEGL